MRGKNTVGRFSIPFELAAVSEGLAEDVQNPLDQWLDWWRYSDEDTRIDPVYDVGDYDGGRVWSGPIRLRVVRHSIEQGRLGMVERGFYTQDNMTFWVNESEFTTKLPNVAYVPDPFLRDRVTWRGKVFTPALVNPRAHIYNTAVVVAIQCDQVNPEELVNDPQFNWYVKRYADGSIAGTDITGVANRPTRREDQKWSPPKEDEVYGT